MSLKRKIDEIDEQIQILKKEKYGILKKQTNYFRKKYKYNYDTKADYTLFKCFGEDFFKLSDDNKHIYIDYAEHLPTFKIHYWKATLKSRKKNGGKLYIHDLPETTLQDVFPEIDLHNCEARTIQTHFIGKYFRVTLLYYKGEYMLMDRTRSFVIMLGTILIRGLYKMETQTDQTVSYILGDVDVFVDHLRSNWVNTRIEFFKEKAAYIIQKYYLNRLYSAPDGIFFKKSLRLLQDDGLVTSF